MVDEQRTFADLGMEKLTALCRALQAEPGSNPLLGAFRTLTHAWGHHLIGAVPAYRSNISDDEAPFEFSMACSDRGPEIQFYVDPQGAPPTPRSNMVAARAALDALAREYGVPLDDLRAVEPLFLPDEPGPPFSLWIGASWARGRDLLFKLYLNPNVRGRELSRHVVATALRELGFHEAWAVAESALSRCHERVELAILSLDLSRRTTRRVKLYVRHHGATADDIAAIAALTRDHSASEIRRFYATLAETSSPLLAKPPITELVFADPHTNRPSATTLEFPIAKYVDNDDVARRRIERCLHGFGLNSEPYTRAIHAFAARPLDARAGLHSHVTLRRDPGGPRIAIYFACEAYAPDREA